MKKLTKLTKIAENIMKSLEKDAISLYEKKEITIKSLKSDFFCDFNTEEDELFITNFEKSEFKSILKSIKKAEKKNSAVSYVIETDARDGYGNKCFSHMGLYGKDKRSVDTLWKIFDKERKKELKKFSKKFC